MNKQSVQLRALLLVVLSVVAILLLVPSFVTDLPQFWKSYLPTQRLHLGLDLQGGTHLIMNVETDKAIAHALERQADRLNDTFKTKAIAGATARVENGKLDVSYPTDAATQVKDLLDESFSELKVEQSSAREGKTIAVLDYSLQQKAAMKELALEQSLETIRNRIDQFGVSEPIIQREGDDGILVQLPGIQDPERAKELIGRTAVLELKLLPSTGSAEEYNGTGKALPDNLEILDGIETHTDPTTGRTTRDKKKYLVEKKTHLTGDTIVNAQPRPGRSGIDSPYVEWELNAEGAEQFEKVTAANVGRRLAIVLDNTVYSAPVIKDRIGGGRAVIEGDFTLNEARDLAIVLRAGALPAPVTMAEERTVGPSLGQDSINDGVLSFIVGGGAVLIFMILYYRGAGVVADVAVVMNIVLLLAALSLFQATLTLPGIAGIVLTLGMAVDANVLINERIREELRLGKAARAAIEAGYERALPSILDSNVTTFLSGVILFQFGSGPVKGFAVTLCVGIITTVFTAVLGTRVYYDYRIASRQLQTVSV